MKQQLNATRIVMMLAIVAATIGFTAFRQKNASRQKAFREGYSRGDEDTTTRRKRDRIKNELNVDELDQVIKNQDEQMAALNTRIKTIELPDIQKQISEELKKVDFEKINYEISEALNAVDLKKMKTEIKRSTEDLQKLNTHKIKKQMENVRIQLEKNKENLNIDLKTTMQQMEEEMQKAKESMLKAKEQMTNIKLLTNALHKDGLIDKSKAFKIEVMDSELHQDGTKQPGEVNDKYRKFLKKVNFTI